MVNAKPLRIDWQLVTSMVHPDQDLHLDGLLAAAAVAEAGITEPSDPRGLDVIRALPLAAHESDAGWCWCASRLAIAWAAPPALMPWVRRPDYGLAAEKQGEVWIGRRDQIEVKTGPLRTYFDTLNVQPADHAQAWCMGDPDRVRALLARIDQIGPARRLGHGRVRDVTVTVDERAHAMWRDRILPEPREGHEPIVARTHPPYWASEDRQVAYAPLEPAMLETESTTEAA